MPSRKNLSRRKQPVKRLLDDVLPISSAKTKIIPKTLVAKDTQDSPSSSEAVSCSSSMLKRYEVEVKKEQQTSPDPTLQENQPSSVQYLEPEQVR